MATNSFVLVNPVVLRLLLSTGPNKDKATAPEEYEIPSGDWSPAEEKALVRKLDLRILLMFIGYLDRQNVANAKVLNVGTPDQKERGLRMGSAYTGLGAAGMVSGFIAIGTQNIEGIPAILFGVVVFFALPTFPHQSKGFLTPREEEIAIRRLPPNAPSALDKITRDDILKELKDPVLWLFACGMLFVVIPIAGANSAFIILSLSKLWFAGAAALLPAILVGIGFTTSIQANGIAAVVNAWPPTQLGFNRVFASSLFFLPRVYLHRIPLSGHTELSAFKLISILNFPKDSTLSKHFDSTAKGTARSTVNSALTLTMYAGGLVIGPQIFPSGDAPLYVPGLWASLGLYAAGLLCFSGIPVVLRRQMKNEPVRTVTEKDEKELMAEQA
ncbi:hypothetical protein HDU93_001979 [Gonapodya sp. JEL0774]|nr:hypothetical protein HDU93_001979 [Gonapodya sp. JEL0774]